jgi:murein DD-endopeptidase MepM/ murein hydrolase activator NlpD
MAGSLALGIGATGFYTHPEVWVDRSAAPPIAAVISPSTASPATVAKADLAVHDLINSAPVQAMENAGNAVVAAVRPAVTPKPEIVTRDIEIERGVTFSDLLIDADVPDADALAAASALDKVYDLRLLKSGQDVALSFTRIGNEESLSSITFQPEATKEVTVARNTQGNFIADLRLVPVTRQHFAARAEIHSSLYEAGEAAHVPHALMASFIRIYSHEIDFQRDIRPGDRFEILYDQPVTQSGTPAGEGTIIYAALTIGGKVKPVYRVTFNDGTVDYFDERGESIRRALLRTPVAAAHITSGFGMRMHPILGYSKMHQGVDFGAPTGSPIFAAGNGVVAEIGTKGGYGRYIRLRHNGQLETVYAHMSRFGQGLYHGAQVQQGEVIGYVGASGRATGPHLHFEVHVAGKPVNPLSVNLPTGRMLEGKILTAFKQGQAKIRQEFNTLTAENGTFFTHASATAPAFAVKEAQTCGLRGGC